MNRPTPDQIQAMTELIAKLLGWTALRVVKGVLFGLRPEDAGKNVLWEAKVPNWPGDRNASYELPVKAGDRDYFIAASQIAANHNFPCRLLDLVQPLLWPAYWESLAWLLYKGYRWVECDSCGGKGKIPVINNKAHLQYGMKMPCPACNGQGGKFVKEVTDG